MMKLVQTLYKNLGGVRIWGYSPSARTPINVAFGYDVGKFSADCLVLLIYFNKSAQSNLGTGPRRGSCATRWVA